MGQDRMAWSLSRFPDTLFVKTGMLESHRCGRPGHKHPAWANDATRSVDMDSRSLAAYYEQNEFNPVPISLNTTAAWEAHLAKRVNLYERHLGIPPALMRGRSALEFGCNSGENALVLAHFGADLTLVEPNQQVLPRLHELFKRYGQHERIIALEDTGITDFESQKRYDLVVCEGFLYTLENRDELLAKICRLIAPGGYGVVSFNDRCGMCIEYIKRLVNWRTCQAAGLQDVHGSEALEWAQRLFGEDFAALNASRPFEAWWKDTMVNPFISEKFFWSYQDILPVLEEGGCGYLSTSPKWSSVDHFSWYKNVTPPEELHRGLLDDWSKNFLFFLTGTRVSNPEQIGATRDVLDEVSRLIHQISVFTADIGNAFADVTYPTAVDGYLGPIPDDRIQRLRGELADVFEAMSGGDAESIREAYSGTEVLRTLWGAPYHYISFKRNG